MIQYDDAALVLMKGISFTSRDVSTSMVRNGRRSHRSSVAMRNRGVRKTLLSSRTAFQFLVHL